jgi:hypothetical protein
MRTRPSQIELFDILYGIAARNGREEALFGGDVLLARPAFERMLIGNDFPRLYLEFPLMGTPGFDVLAGYNHVDKGAVFREGAGYGRQDMFDWFAEVCESGTSASVGFEVDSSAGRTDVAGVYLQQRRKTELVGSYLSSLGEEVRTASYHSVRERLPKGWGPSYVGLFPGRANTPMRIGGYLSPRAQARCADDPECLRGCLEQAGFASYTDEMLLRCSRLMGIAPSVDFQLDIFPDGSLGSTFGLSLSFNEVSPHESRACLESGYGSCLMGLLESWGLVDERWRHVAGIPFARRIGYEREDGGVGRLALCIALNFVKVKFTDGVAQPAKFYVMCVGKDL